MKLAGFHSEVANVASYISYVIRFTKMFPAEESKARANSYIA